MIDFKHIATDNFLKIEDACRDTYENNLFVGIHGNTGWGKTFGYRSVQNDKNLATFLSMKSQLAWMQKSF